MGHKKADRSRLVSGAVREPTSVTLRMTDGDEGRAEALVVRNRALQLQLGEA